MALEIKLSQKLSQSLVMTPQLQHAIKLLGMGRLDYVEEIERELLENPVLEDSGDQSGADEHGGVERSRLLSQDENTGLPDFSIDERAIHGDSRETGDSLTDLTALQGDPLLARQDQFFDFGEIQSDAGPSRGVSRNFDGDERPSLEANLTKATGIAEHLMNQLRTTDVDARLFPLGEAIVGNLDKNGYLECTLEEVLELANANGDDFSLIECETVLRVIQMLDPLGVAARDLRECLLVQLEHAGRQETLAWRLIEKHLDKLENQRFDTVAKAEGVTINDVVEAMKSIRNLEPRPGRQFADEPPIYITPDVFVRKVGDEYVIVMNESGMPRLRVSQEYKDLLAGTRSKSHPERDYLKDRVQSAAWLIRSIHQRQQTIMKVTESIMNYQREFLERGVSALKPLVLRDIAQDVGMHESTVSRVTNNKFVHTPQGVFELKFFFTSGLKSDGGDVSSQSVKELIREMVAKEDPKQPFSDQAIVEDLRSKGIDIARRTVAKYREMLGILSSSRRKRIY